MDKKQIGWLLIGGFVVFIFSIVSFSFEPDNKDKDSRKAKSEVDRKTSSQVNTIDSLESVLKEKDSVISALRIQLAYFSNTKGSVDTTNAVVSNTKRFSNGIQIKTTQVESFDDFTNITVEFFSTKDVKFFIKHQDVQVNHEGNTFEAKSSSEATASASRFNLSANTRKKVTFHCPLNESINFIEHFYCGFRATWPDKPYKGYDYKYEARNLKIE
ncbi:hypothetical protein [Tunicatimonas pelagia]|uniref:hypothetical protein n=1 Tax=Tunicatimonas pelagia TaxID=931531 RepID=UPI002666617A|nr:hypothetical protein [Tunicatimonas pelagia]WKN46512.1 hypothetical protein P0M28_30930 [Tunicatimonas pelagia]